MKGYSGRESKAVDAIKKAIPSSLKRDMLKESKGMSAELYENKVFPNHYLGCAIDGVGTKLILAEALEKYDTIGIDCVAMSANDLATFGKMSPFLFMDCISCQSKIQENKITGDIVKGISKGLEQCDASTILKNSIRMNFGKGETASVDELLSSPKQGCGFDVVGCMIGFIPKSTFPNLKEGDKIISLPSSGPHSNGYTSLRHNLLKGDFETRKEYKKFYKGKHLLEDEVEGRTLGDWLLEPTRIYVKEMANISSQFSVLGVNNTGYGLKNLNRLPGSFQFVLDAVPKPPPFFSCFQKETGYSDEQMYTTFNMGMGFFVVVREENVDSVLDMVKDAQLIGSVKKSPKKATVLHKDGKKIILEGY